MKKIFFIALIGVCLALTGCVKQTATEKSNNNQSTTNTNQNADINQPINPTTNKTSDLLRQCPDILIDNQMPCACSNSSCNECENPPRKYYVLNGKRREISEFDRNWTEKNCNIETQVVY